MFRPHPGGVYLRHIVQVDEMPNCFDKLDAYDDGPRDERRECMCIGAIVVIGTALGCAFVFAREALGMKM